MNKQTYVGFNPGNGWTKLSVWHEEKVKNYKQPSVYSPVEPEAELLPNGKTRKLQAHSLVFGQEGKELWFGQDTLGGKTIRYIDGLRYDPDHLSILFKSALVGWANKHKVDINTLGKLNIVACIPNFDQDKVKAERVFRTAFNVGSKANYIRTPKDTYRITTHFETLIPECYGYAMANNGLKGYTILADLGYGTIIFSLLQNQTPISISSFNAGLLHMLQDNAYKADAYELSILRNKGNLDNLDLIPYCNELLNRIAGYTRKLEYYGGCNNLILMGGTTNQLPNEIKNQLKYLARNVKLLDEYTNSEACLTICKRGSTNA